MYNVHVQYTYLETGRKASLSSLFRRECKLFFYLTTVYTYCVYPAFLFNDCVLILCLFCNIKKSKTTAKLSF